LVHIVYISTHASVVVGLHHSWDGKEVRDLSPKNQEDHEHIGHARPFGHWLLGNVMEIGRF